MRGKDTTLAARECLGDQDLFASYRSSRTHAKENLFKSPAPLMAPNITNPIPPLYGGLPWIVYMKDIPPNGQTAASMG